MSIRAGNPMMTWIYVRGYWERRALKASDRLL